MPDGNGHPLCSPAVRSTVNVPTANACEWHRLYGDRLLGCQYRGSQEYHDIWLRKNGKLCRFPMLRAIPMLISLWFPQVDVEFSGRTAGGNPSHPTFMYNPQYRVHIKPDMSERAKRSTANVKCQLVGDDQTSYNVKLVWNQGERVTEYVQGPLTDFALQLSDFFVISFSLQTQDVVADSGEYRYGQTSVSKAGVGGKLQPKS
jgi:hypothetical protein